MMPQINFYNRNTTPQAVLCSFEITAFVQLRLHGSLLRLSFQPKHLIATKQQVLWYINLQFPGVSVLKLL